MLQPPVCRDADLTLSIKKDAISRISLRQPSRSRRKNVMKTRGRPFQKGNPGRPKGARDTATLAVERLLEGEREAIGRKCVELALSGDTTALRLAMERIAPVRKARVRLTLPPVETVDPVDPPVNNDLGMLALAGRLAESALRTRDAPERELHQQLMLLPRLPGVTEQSMLSGAAARAGCCAIRPDPRRRLARTP